MNDTKRAIELLRATINSMKINHMMKDMVDGVTREEIKEYREDFKLINIAISALEKQIAEEPEWEEPTNEARDNAEAYCPSCDYLFEDETLHCPVCGQKIDWSV